MASINERIKAAIEPIVPICVPDFYDGAAKEYCTFNYNERGVGYGDGRPEAIRYFVQLHYYLPLGKSAMRAKRELCRAILDAGFSWPEVVNASDDKDQHYAIEFEGLDRGADDGEI